MTCLLAARQWPLHVRKRTVGDGRSQFSVDRPGYAHVRALLCAPGSTFPPLGSHQFPSLSLCAMAWKKVLGDLQGLSVPKSRVYGLLKQLRLTDEEIDDIFSTVLEHTGEEGLIDYLTYGLLAHQSLPTGEKKTITYVGQILDEDGKYKTTTSKNQFDSEADFASWCGRLLIGGLQRIDKEQPQDALTVRQFKDLVNGGTYIDADLHGLKERVLNLERYNCNCSYSDEDEFAKAMMRSLKEEGFAENPILRPDLRLHKVEEGNHELDVVIFEGSNKAFIGSSKHVLQGTDKVAELLKDGQKIYDRSRNPKDFPSYRDFGGRCLGLAIRVDHLKPQNEAKIMKFCGMHGVGLYTRNGASLMRLPNQFAARSTQNINLAVPAFNSSKVMKFLTAFLRK